MKINLALDCRQVNGGTLIYPTSFSSDMAGFLDVVTVGISYDEEVDELICNFFMIHPQPKAKVFVLTNAILAAMESKENKLLYAQIYTGLSYANGDIVVDMSESLLTYIADHRDAWWGNQNESVPIDAPTPFPQVMEQLNPLPQEVDLDDDDGPPAADDNSDRAMWYRQDMAAAGECDEEVEDYVADAPPVLDDSVIFDQKFTQNVELVPSVNTEYMTHVNHVQRGANKFITAPKVETPNEQAVETASPAVIRTTAQLIDEYSEKDLREYAKSVNVPPAICNTAPVNQLRLFLKRKLSND